MHVPIHWNHTKSISCSFPPHWDSSSSSVRGWPNTFTCKVLRLQSNTQSIFLTVLVQGNTSIFICMGADLARGPAIASSLGFVATHIRPGISQRGLWRVWPSPRSLSSSLRLPSTPTSALPLMLARGAAPSIVASQASLPRLILSAQAAHSCGLHPQHDSRQLFTQPRRPLPDQPCSGSKGWTELLRGLSCRQGSKRRSRGPRLYQGAFIGIVCQWRFYICRFIKWKKNSPDPLGFQERNLFYVGKEFTLTTTEKVIHLKWKWVFLGIVLQQTLQATYSRKPCVPNTFRIPMKQGQYKNRVNFSLQNPRRMFSNRKRRRWENAVIYSLQSQETCSAVPEKKKTTQITQLVHIWPSETNPSYLWPHCVTACIVLITGTTTCRHKRSLTVVYDGRV